MESTPLTDSRDSYKIKLLHQKCGRTRNQSADDIENQSTIMPIFYLEQASGSPSAKGPLGVSRAIGSYRPGS